MNQQVVSVHKNQLQNHQYLREEEYSTGYDYFQEEYGVEESIDEFENIPIEAMIRIHSYDPREFMIVQKNPNYDVEDNNGKPIESHYWLRDLLNENNLSQDYLEMVINHSRTTISNYFCNEGGDGFRQLLDAVNHEIADGQLQGDLSNQEGFENYLNRNTSKQYNTRETNQFISENAGFFSDFAYTNVMKFQAPGQNGHIQQDDREWFRKELELINPKLVLTLGIPAWNTFVDHFGFDVVAKSDNAKGKNNGQVAVPPEDHDIFQDMVVASFYHLQSSSTSPLPTSRHYSEHANETLRLASEELSR